jgi:DNA-binding response OmpR family regulator
MFIETDSLLPRDTYVSIDVRLPDSDEPVTLEAQVVYAREADPDAASAGAAGLGVKFTELSSMSLTWLEEFITLRTIAEAESTGHNAGRQPLNVVVVEDDPIYAKRASDSFGSRGDRVRIAKDGMEALATCLADHPDVIVSDVNMPRMDGWQLLRLLRARKAFAQTPVIFTTRLTSEKERLRGYESGVDDYIGKPYADADLLARVDRLIGRRDTIPPPPPGHTEPMNVRGLRGDLGHVSIASLLSFLELEQRSGELTVHASCLGRIWIRAGRPVRAETMPETPGGDVKAIEKLIDEQQGEFEFRPAEDNGDDRVEQSLSQILLEHARIQDERGAP